MPCPFCGGQWGAGGIGFFLSMLFIILIIAGLILLIMWIVRQSQAGRGMYGEQQPPSTTRALDILNERYAKGELSKEEYEERRSTLTGR